MSRRSAEPPLHIAIDGFVAAGKSSVGASVAQRLGILYLDTGVMYRAVALVALEREIDLSSEESCAGIAEMMDLRLYPVSIADGRQVTVCIGDRDVTWDIRSDAVNAVVAQVSSHQSVRNTLIRRQQCISDGQAVVMVGRDIASVVLPHAQLKIMLTAPLEVRVKRRADEMKRNRPHAALELAHLRQEIQRRDEMDEMHMSRASDMVVVNTETLTVDEVTDFIVALAKRLAWLES